jgi:hypothetical protein
VLSFAHFLILTQTGLNPKRQEEDPLLFVFAACALRQDLDRLPASASKAALRDTLPSHVSHDDIVFLGAVCGKMPCEIDDDTLFLSIFSSIVLFCIALCIALSSLFLLFFFFLFFFLFLRVSHSLAGELYKESHCALMTYITTLSQYTRRGIGNVLAALLKEQLDKVATPSTSHHLYVIEITSSISSTSHRLSHQHRITSMSFPLVYFNLLRCFPEFIRHHRDKSLLCRLLIRMHHVRR